MEKITGIAALVVLLLNVLVGLNLTDEQKTVIPEAIQSCWQMVFPPRVPPKPKNITEVRESEFKFDASEDPLVIALNMTKFSKVLEKKTCDLYEDMSVTVLEEVIDGIGSENNLTANQIKLMKLSLQGGRTVKATEVFSHGREGRYLLMKFTSGRNEAGNYDFMIASYGYSWTLDVFTEEDAIKSFQTTDNVEGVPKDMLPDAAKTDVLDFVKIQTKLSISLQEKEQQTEYFRSLSERSLAYLCPKMNM